MGEEILPTTRTGLPAVVVLIISQETPIISNSRTSRIIISHIRVKSLSNRPHPRVGGLLLSLRKRKNQMIALAALQHLQAKAQVWLPYTMKTGSRKLKTAQPPKVVQGATQIAKIQEAMKRAGVKVAAEAQARVIH